MNHSDPSYALAHQNYHERDFGDGEILQGVTLDHTIPVIESSRQRASLTENERLQLVRLCCTRGEEYLRGKEKFWICRTEEFNATASKRIANARSIVMPMRKLYTARLSKDTQASGTVFIESELDQALRSWNQWVVQAEDHKTTKRAGADEKKRDQEQAKIDRENMLLPMSKKKVFREAVAALSDSNETEAEGSDSNEEKPITKRQKVENIRERKRKLRDRATALDEKYVKQGDCLVEAVQSMSRTFTVTGREEELEKGRVAGLVEETKSVAKEVAELRETLKDTSLKVDRILELLAK
ncbi:hypothetical protein HOY82DRAFT_544232 [Tuber indicum]|nr:hypothetical protein HOY82DRAFT_544232 [Tuber indicum]